MRAMNGGMRCRGQRSATSWLSGLVFLTMGGLLRAQGNIPDATSDPSPQGRSAEPARATAKVSDPPAVVPAESQEPITAAPVVVAAPAPDEQPPATSVPSRAGALAVTVSGAVSLGSHEAGQLFLITEALRKSPHAVPLRIVTGASAGSANALFAGTEACLTNDVTPEQSLGYQAWVNVGLDELFDEERTTRQAIFHKDGLNRAYQHLEKVWAAGLPPDCDFAYGVAVTRRPSTDMKLAEGLVVPRSAERFVARITGGKSGPPQFFNYVDATTSHQRPLLPFVGQFSDDAKALRSIVLASAAFPVAFSPQPIEYCIAGEGAASQSGMCSEPTHVDLFVDGGVFDNNPLGIAYRTAVAGLSDGPDVKLRDHLNGKQPSHADVFYGYIDPDLRTYPIYTPAAVGDQPDEDPVVSLITRMGGQMLADARGHELASLADENIELMEGLWIVRGNYPPISEMLSAFFGFFERDFRDFDFQLGMYDSFLDLRDKSSVRLGTEKYIHDLDALLQGDAKKVPARYRKLACIASQVGEKRYRHQASACSGKELRNFRVLLQVAIDRLWSNCRMLSSEQVALTSHLGCKQARGGLAPPVVDASFVVEGPRYKAHTESEFDYALRLFGDYQFHFRDLGLSPSEGKRARITVRRKLIAMVEALSNAQGTFLDRTAVMTGGRTLINSIYYEPPRKRAYVSVGSSIAAGYLGRLGDLRYLYWNPDFRMLNLRELLSDRGFSFTGQLSLGLEFALLPISGSVWQTAIGVRGGYQFSAEDSIGFDPCNGEEVNDDPRRCSGPVVHTPVNFTLLERVRFSLTPVFYPLPQDFGKKWFELEVGIGAELF